MKIMFCTMFVAALTACGPSITQDERQIESVSVIASFEHDCPREQVIVQSLELSQSGQNTSRAVLQVCGIVRKYRDVGERTWMWTEVKSCPNVAVSVEK